jgi:hypothetical protein
MARPSNIFRELSSSVLEVQIVHPAITVNIMVYY